MTRRATTLSRAALSALHFSGADRLIAPLTRGIGAIFMLHHVHPEQPAPFAPNGILRVSPEFLEQVIRQVRASGFDVVSLDEAHFRLTEGEYRRPFVCFTFDDGYRDNLEYAYPVFKRYDLPFAVYVPTDYIDGRGDLWWLALEKVIGTLPALDVKIDGSLRRFRCTTPAEKNHAFHAIYWWLRSIEEDDARAYVRELAGGIGFDPDGLCNELMMSWDELRQMRADSRVTVGSHTRRHYALAGLTLGEARAEIGESMRRIERELGVPCRHFSFPYGDADSAGEREFELVKEMGLKTAVTSCTGLIRRRHSLELSALPRLALDGDYQRLRYVKVLLSGAPFAFSLLGQNGSRAVPLH
jgi:peptidoglycan/xylan/chitin deacetylase (PgdA/CDA1 family)